MRGGALWRWRGDGGALTLLRRSKKRAQWQIEIALPPAKSNPAACYCPTLSYRCFVRSQSVVHHHRESCCYG
jgi:hypothetical protein